MNENSHSYRRLSVSLSTFLLEAFEIGKSSSFIAQTFPSRDSKRSSSPAIKEEINCRVDLKMRAEVCIGKKQMVVNFDWSLTTAWSTQMEGLESCFWGHWKGHHEWLMLAEGTERDVDSNVMSCHH